MTHFGMLHKKNGIIHVVGPERGLTLPGMTIVCGDSHTSTHGAMGAVAFVSVQVRSNGNGFTMYLADTPEDNAHHSGRKTG